MTGELEALRFVVHGLEHLSAALAAGRETGRPIVAVSALGASAYAGAGWFAAVAAAGRAAYPEVELTAILDCGDRAGDALSALRSGANPVIFTGPPSARVRLEAIAVALGATLIDRRPAALDLGRESDPARAARRCSNSFAAA